MVAKVLVTVLVVLCMASSSLAGQCCPNCGSNAMVGNEVAGFCSECGQATVGGLSISPLVLTGTLLALAGTVAMVSLSGRRGSIRRIEPLPA
jgi:hypothetical protein